MLPSDPDAASVPVTSILPEAGQVEPVTIRPTPGRRRLPVLQVAIVVVALLSGGALFMSGYTMGNQGATEPGTPLAEQEAFGPFWETYHAIREHYAGPDVERSTVIQGAIRGMIDALEDPYSSYLTSEEYLESLQGINGQFEGIGADIATEAPDGTQGCATLGPLCRLVIIAPLAGSPAEAAGLLAGDRVLAVDGTPFDGLTVEAARDRIRGPKGTRVVLTVERGTTPAFELTITRDVIQQDEVVSRDLADGSVGYVRLNGFSDAAAKELSEAYAGHVKAGRSRLILDLRGNPGGYVTAARAVASTFIGSGVVFWEQDAQGVQIASEALAGGTATDPDLKIICLIDGGSASASEIVAGALQDTDRATIMGQTSFGKGSVQRWQELDGEGGAFRLTTARWLTPDKRWIHDVGIIPDVPVTIPDGTPATEDPVLDRALELLGGTSARDGLGFAA